MPGVPDKVVLHPLVLLSVVDHYNRVAKDTKKRVVGVLLGETYKGQVDVTNSFAGEQAGRPSGTASMLQGYAVHCSPSRLSVLAQQQQTTTQLSRCITSSLFPAAACMLFIGV